MPKPLEQVLADAREDAQALRRNGHAAQAASIERVCEDVQAAMLPYLTRLSDSEAKLRSGRSIDYLRGRFAEWEARGMAGLDERGKRWFREIIVPPRAQDTAARLAGQRGEPLRSASHG